jgi:glycosyltransferase involved in cell wall biosynthesis
VVYQAIDCQAALEWAKRERASLRRELGLPENAMLIGMIGRLSPQKAPIRFLDAMALIAEVTSDVYFCVVGDGPLRKTLEEHSSRLGISDRVLFVGHQASSLSWNRAFDVLVHTAIYEGFPRVIVDSMLVGTPVIGTAVDGVVDAIGEDWERGLMVYPGTPAQIAAAVKQLIRDPERAESMVRRARIWAERISNLETALATLEEAYRDALIRCR